MQSLQIIHSHNIFNTTIPEASSSVIYFLTRLCRGVSRKSLIDNRDGAVQVPFRTSGMLFRNTFVVAVSITIFRLSSVQAGTTCYEGTGVQKDIDEQGNYYCPIHCSSDSECSCPEGGVSYCGYCPNDRGSSHVNDWVCVCSGVNNADNVECNPKKRYGPAGAATAPTTTTWEPTTSAVPETEIDTPYPATATETWTRTGTWTPSSSTTTVEGSSSDCSNWVQCHRAFTGLSAFYGAVGFVLTTLLAISKVRKK